MTPSPCAKSTGYLSRPLVQGIVLAVLALLVYSNTFQVPFVFDDISSITENPVVQDLANYLPNGGGYSDRPNRFIGYLTFALNYQLGGLNVVGYHLVNLAIHIGNALLVYALLRLTLRTPFFRRAGHAADGREADPAPPSAPDSIPPPLPSPSGGGDAGFLPFLTAALFVVHPVQTQAVTYIVQRLTSLTTLFYLGATVFYLRWRLAREAGAPVASRSVWPCWVLSVLSALLAMKTKEIAFTLPFVVLLYDFAFFGKERREWRLLIPLLLTAAVIPLSMISVAKPLDQLLTDVNAATAESALSRADYLYTQFNVIVTYLRLLFFPVEQNLDYAYPISRTLLEPATLASLLLLLTLFALGLYALYASRRPPLSGSEDSVRAARLFGFGILWFFITLSVESSVIPITDVIFEHRLYLPSIGFFLAVAALASLIHARAHAAGPAMAKATTAVLIAAVLILAGTAYARNGVWGNWETLWRDVLSKNPKNARAYNNLGTYYGNRQQYWEAIAEFEKAARLYPRYLDAHFNLGRAYLVVGRFGDSAREFRNTLLIDPNHVKSKEFLAQLEILLRNGAR